MGRGPLQLATSKATLLRPQYVRMRAVFETDGRPEASITRPPLWAAGAVHDPFEGPRTLSFGGGGATAAVAPGVLRAGRHATALVGGRAGGGGATAGRGLETAAGRGR
jgi:hypothetical protein